MLTHDEEVRTSFRVAVQHGNLGLLADLYTRCVNGRLKPTDISHELTLDTLRRYAQQHRIAHVRGLVATIKGLQNGRTNQANIDHMLTHLREIDVDPAEAGLDPATLQTLRERAYDNRGG